MHMLRRSSSHQSAVADEIRGVAELLGGLSRRMERIELILTVKEPSSSAAADAYDGLRKQVVTAVTERLAHLAQLAQLDAALGHGAEGDVLAQMVDAWLQQAALERIDDPRHSRAGVLFELVEDLGGPLRVIESAYCDAVTGRVIRQGRVRREAAPAAAGERAPGPEPGHPPIGPPDAAGWPARHSSPAAGPPGAPAQSGHFPPDQEG
jgi:hypothetical protein